ncbi:MAG: threonylcarbamoyl-AMP synthase [Prevotellaceae bacterium]|jgi:L-threonylcarbamoyladenylate synthase|nr:threonylcarbamoyl-AMP synthase [Prevotellaceae bacterium]
MINDIRKAVEVLKQGGIILYPTDTVWGIGCDVTNDVAVKKLYRLKQKKEEIMAMLMLVSDTNMIYKYVQTVPDIAIQLIEISDKPLTVVFPNACGVSPEITAPDGSVGIRLVNHEYCNSLIRILKHPLVSTSANISGVPAPRTFSEISKKIIEGVDYVVDAKYTGKMTGKPSSIIKIGVSGEVKIIRS